MKDELLKLLTARARFATADQVATVCGIGLPVAARHLEGLAKNGWIESATVIVRRPKLDRPMMSDADPTSKVASVAWALETRWANTEPESIRVYWATTRTAQIYGGRFAGIKQPLQIEHDLLLLDVFGKYHRDGVAVLWQTEDQLRKVAFEFAGKVPDAAVSTGLGWTVIEIGGQYSCDRLNEFVTAMTLMGLAFEVW